MGEVKTKTSYNNVPFKTVRPYNGLHIVSIDASGFKHFTRRAIVKGDHVKHFCKFTNILCCCTMFNGHFAHFDATWLSRRRDLFPEPCMNESLMEHPNVKAFKHRKLEIPF